MKKFAMLAAAIITASLILAIPLTGCEGEISVTTASLSKAAMAKSVNETTMEPIEKTTVFTPDAPVIYCTVKLSNAPSDTEIKAEWIYVEGEAGGVADYLIYEDMVTTEGTRYLGFSLTSDTLWPRGEYEVVLYIDGKESLSVPFTVE